MSNFLGTNFTRGIRNNNPGNLRYTAIPWQGKVSYAQNKDWEINPSNVVKEFEQFVNMAYGIRAMAIDITGDVKENNYSLAQLIYEYAPPHENDTTAYIQTVKQRAGIADANAPLQFTFLSLSEVLRAMIMMENGADGNKVTNQDIVDGINLMPATVLETLGEFVVDNKESIGGALLGLTVTGALLYTGYRYYKNRAA